MSDIGTIVQRDQVSSATIHTYTRKRTVTWITWGACELWMWKVNEAVMEHCKQKRLKVALIWELEACWKARGNTFPSYNFFF